jgi:hypothetical protein
MNDIKTVKGLPFSGIAKDFKVWHFRVLAYTNMHKCCSILDDDNIVAPPASEQRAKTNDAHKQKNYHPSRMSSVLLGHTISQQPVVGL